MLGLAFGGAMLTGCGAGDNGTGATGTTARATAGGQHEPGLPNPRTTPNPTGAPTPTSLPELPRGGLLPLNIQPGRSTFLDVELDRTPAEPGGPPRLHAVLQ